MDAEAPTDELHPVSTDEPALILHRPRRKLKQVAITFAVLPLLIAAPVGYISAKVGAQDGYEQSSEYVDRRVLALETDLAERRAQRDREKAASDEQSARQATQIAELRRLVCVLADHSQPRDAQIEEVRTRYGCDGGPYPVPSPSTTPSTSGRGGGTVPASSPGRRATSRPPTGGPRPVPSVLPTPGPPPDVVGPLLGCVDLPVLGEVCL